MSKASDKCDGNAKPRPASLSSWSSLLGSCCGSTSQDHIGLGHDHSDADLLKRHSKSYGTIDAEPLPLPSSFIASQTWIASMHSSTSLAATAASKVPQAARGFLEFVNASPSPFHAVAEARRRLDAAGFTALKERECWDGKLVPGGKYYFTRNASSVIAFVVGQKFKPGNGFSMVAAHTDSPCLKLKPVSGKTKNGYLMVGVQTYGGGLWHTWFDRDLGVAGRVIVNGKEHKLVKIDEPILRIPTLAIHLDRAVNDGFTFNKENHLIPVLASVAEAELNAPAAPKVEGAKHHSILLAMLAEKLGANVDATAINDVELCLFDTTPAVIGGALSEYVFAPRCDNLVMSYTGLSALLNHAADAEAVANDEAVALVALFDNEEVGSLSAYGADSHFLESALRRVTSGVATDAHGRSSSAFEEAMQKSYLVSADMAHALHPNHAEKHEDLHQPRMNKGVVIKHNANQRYATTAPTSALLRAAAQRAGVPLQEFVVRNDSPCGSTIGPILSGKLGLRTIDVGNPQLSMHSIREQAGTKDIEEAILLFTAVFKHCAQIDKELIVD
ncbi:aminopeptidase I zinc metalloprotease-domain-containing protein [Catenaria anguillulae PL171]|uniref:aspartyl aminopeptidase n=1 Tax=Catenaria anguillulae PL171 TaxID=765915 RepID=A0A1Y2H9S7_9FUNG|nr:aminopeptidase I zinc metalloprotease-domain-containing protein [Catenaria anguillulae PL171]